MPDEKLEELFRLDRQVDEMAIKVREIQSVIKRAIFNERQKDQLRLWVEEKDRA